MVSGVDLMMLPWVAGLWRLNSLSRQTLETGAAAIAWAARAYPKRTVSTKNMVGINEIWFQKSKKRYRNPQLLRV